MQPPRDLKGGWRQVSRRRRTGRQPPAFSVERTRRSWRYRPRMSRVSRTNRLTFSALTTSPGNFVRGFLQSSLQPEPFVLQMSSERSTWTMKNCIASMPAAGFRNYVHRQRLDQEHDQSVPTRMWRARFEDPGRSMRSSHSPGQRPRATHWVELSSDSWPHGYDKETITRECGPCGPHSYACEDHVGLCPG